MYDSGVGAWDEVVGESSPFTELSHTITSGIVMGTDYRFRIRAGNIHGFGEFSDEVIVRADDKPGVPGSVSTTADGLNVNLAWTPPVSDNGSPITLYKLFVETKLGTLAEV